MYKFEMWGKNEGGIWKIKNKVIWRIDIIDIWGILVEKYFIWRNNKLI
jgi:hypothetical protein